MTKIPSSDLSTTNANVHNQQSPLICILQCVTVLCICHQLINGSIISLTWPCLNRTPSLTITSKTLQTYRGSLLAVLYRKQVTRPVVLTESSNIQKHISHLKNHKASDACRIAAEHIKLASPLVTDLMMENYQTASTIDLLFLSIRRTHHQEALTVTDTQLWSHSLVSLW